MTGTWGICAKWTQGFSTHHFTLSNVVGDKSPNNTGELYKALWQNQQAPEPHVTFMMLFQKMTMIYDKEKKNMPCIYFTHVLCKSGSFVLFLELGKNNKH